MGLRDRELAETLARTIASSVAVFYRECRAGGLGRRQAFVLTANFLTALLQVAGKP